MRLCVIPHNSPLMSYKFYKVKIRCSYINHFGKSVVVNKDWFVKEERFKELMEEIKKLYLIRNPEIELKEKSLIKKAKRLYSIKKVVELGESEKETTRIITENVKQIREELENKGKPEQGT